VVCRQVWQNAQKIYVALSTPHIDIFTDAGWMEFDEKAGKSASIKEITLQQIIDLITLEEAPE
jgi:hypothetical protein